MSSPAYVDLEDFTIALYASLDDALTASELKTQNGKLIPRPGPTPDVDDREILCVAVLQEILGFESDNQFYDWFTHHPTMRKMFPRKLSRQNYADRRALLTPLMKRLGSAYCTILGEHASPFSLLTPIPSMSAG
jgi:hypothetical protein